MKEMTDERFSEVLNLISDGASLRTATRKLKMSSETFYKYINDKENGHDRTLRYARACDERATALVEDMLEIADDGSNDTYEDEDGKIRTDWDVLGRSKLRVDTRKWIASKLRPKKYGDSTQVKITDNDGNTPSIKIEYIGTDKFLQENTKSKDEG